MAEPEEERKTGTEDPCVPLVREPPALWEPCASVQVKAFQGLYSFVTSFALLEADIDDKKSLEKLSAALKRLRCPKKSSGKLEVSPEVHKQWLQGGEPRKALLNIFVKNHGDKDCD